VLDARLKYAVAAAQAGSFTAAAQNVGITQSALTRSVADLELEVGFAIFHRAGRGITLTEQGAEFVERAARLLEDARDLLGSGQKRRDPYAGAFRVGVGPASLEWYVTDSLVGLLKRRPTVRLEVSGSNFERIVQQLRNGALDLAVGFDVAFAAWPDLRREVVGELKSSLFVRLGHPLAVLASVTSAELAQYELVSPSVSRPYEQVFHSFYEDHGIDWRDRLHIIDYFPAVMEIVASTDAIGVVDHSYAKKRAFLRRFTTLADVDLAPVAKVCAAVRAKWEPKPAAKAFISALKLGSGFSQ
jgi:DNA-binding transcriptional LysR family regulator